MDHGEKIDFQKVAKHLYLSSAQEGVLVDVPAMNSHRAFGRGRSLCQGKGGRDKENPFRHRGMARQMAERLIAWAGENGWKQIEADAFEELPIIYELTGSTGYGFWSKLGFRVVARYPHPHLHEFPEFIARLERQALEAGIDQERAKDSIVMRLDLEGSSGGSKPNNGTRQG